MTQYLLRDDQCYQQERTREAGNGEQIESNSSKKRGQSATIIVNECD